jgi:hypothetical protein
MSIGIHQAGRKCETIALEFEDVKVLMPNDPRNETGYNDGPVLEIEFERRKNTGNRIISACYIKDPVWVNAVLKYIETVPVPDRTGRFFRKLQFKDNKFVATTKQVIGKNTAANFCIQIALFLGYPIDEAKYVEIFISYNAVLIFKLKF